jgi:hypothetical protein
MNNEKNGSSQSRNTAIKKRTIWELQKNLGKKLLIPLRKSDEEVKPVVRNAKID